MKPTVGPRKYIIGLGAAGLAAAVTWFGLSLLDPRQSREEFAAAAVTELKTQTEFPQRIDDVTTLDDVTAEGASIRYHYTLTGVDPATLSKQTIADTVRPEICSTPETKQILDQDITMRYSYVVEETNDQYDIDFTKTDCSGTALGGISRRYL